MLSAHIKDSQEKYKIGKIVCAGRNYEEHAKELGNDIPDRPVIFLKPTSSVIYSGGEVIHPTFSNELHHEVELVLIIGKDIKNASKKEAERAILGYGVGLDMTLRDVQRELRKKGAPWTLAKCFDTSTVISNFVSKHKYKIEPDETIELGVNGQIKQSDTLKGMIFKPVELVEYISSVMKLEKGDLIFTGTPPGVSKVERGDRLEARLGQIADLFCTIK